MFCKMIDDKIYEFIKRIDYKIIKMKPGEENVYINDYIYANIEKFSFGENFNCTISVFKNNCLQGYVFINGNNSECLITDDGNQLRLMKRFQNKILKYLDKIAIEIITKGE